MFTLVDQVVLRQLPVPRPDRLVYFDSPSFSYPVVREVQRQVPSLQSAFGWSIDRRHVTFNAGPEPVDVMDATGRIYETLGIVPAPAGCCDPTTTRGGGRRVELQRLAAALRRRSRHRRPHRSGRAHAGHDCRRHAQGFFGVAPGLAPELTVPAALAARLRPEDADILEEVGQSWLHIMGRIRDPLTLSEADAALQVAWPRVLETTTPMTVPAKDRTRYLGRQTKLMEADTGFSRVRRRFQQPLWLLASLVGLLLVIGCGTIANMMLSRTLARGHELSLRRAIGAGRGRLIRQLLTEALLLTGAGACLGVLIGMWGSQALVRLLSTSESIITVNSTPTLSTIGAAGSLALVIALVITACSAMCALRAEAGDALRAAPRSGGASAAERRLGALLVSVQVALSLTLVVGASVFALNLHRLLTQPIGMDRARLIVVQADATFGGHTEEKLPRYYDSALARLQALPGILSASYSRKPPVSNTEARGGRTPRSTISPPTSAASGRTSTRCRTTTSTRRECGCWPAGRSIVATRRKRRPSSSSTPADRAALRDRIATGPPARLRGRRPAPAPHRRRRRRQRRLSVRSRGRARRRLPALSTGGGDARKPQPRVRSEDERRPPASRSPPYARPCGAKTRRCRSAWRPWRRASPSRSCRSVRSRCWPRRWVALRCCWPPRRSMA